MIEIFMHGKYNKRGEWSGPKIIIIIDRDIRNIYMPGKNGKTVSVAFEDVGLEIMVDSFANTISDTLDTPDHEINQEMDKHSDHDLT